MSVQLYFYLVTSSLATPNECLFGQITSSGCVCPLGSVNINGICTKQCHHGDFSNITGKCTCWNNWAKAGITDTIDWIDNECTQFKCQSDSECQKLTGFSDSSCPVKNWNCYCGIKHHGWGTDKVQCMAIMYSISTFTIKLYIELCKEWIWKIFALLALVSLPFGRRRIRCDHHTSWLAYVKKIFAIEIDCAGNCVNEKKLKISDDLALSVYWLKSCIWWYGFLSLLVLSLAYIWSIIFWIIIGVILVAFMCLMLCGAMSDGGDGCEDACGDACCACGSSNFDPNYNYNTFNTTNYNIIYVGGPYPDNNCCCYDPYREDTNTEQDKFCSQCLCCCLIPIFKMIENYPKFPENLHGGLTGFIMGTHILRNTISRWKCIHMILCP